MSERKKGSGRKFASTIWLAGHKEKLHMTLQLPSWMAQAHKIDEQRQLVLIDKPDGILIKRLDDID